eukprot:gb/GFBE01060657.1/.p1 GENE.gb/GFBE01060657.1/~~gb/GFBE01060657.1/.p1  ORF type:complete len:182 (+),score=65.49 gb/GFBE01060657.1/:1-546(+)
MVDPAVADQLPELGLAQVLRSLESAVGLACESLAGLAHAVGLDASAPASGAQLFYIGDGPADGLDLDVTATDDDAADGAWLHQLVLWAMEAAAEPGAALCPGGEPGVPDGDVCGLGLTAKVLQAVAFAGAVDQIGFSVAGDLKAIIPEHMMTMKSNALAMQAINKAIVIEKAFGMFVLDFG